MNRKHGAYWISPGGNVVPVESRHIDSVIAHPEKFGISKKEIDDEYEKRGEQIGVESDSRDEILSKIIQKGWIRLRYNDRKDGWVAQVSRLDKRKKDYIWSFVDGMLEGKFGPKSSQYSEMFILDLKGTTLYRANFGELHKKFFEEGIQYHTEITLIEDLKEDAYLTEKTLSRVWQHVNSKRPLAIMTAFRNENTLAENKRKNLELAKTVREAGFGYFWLEGHWVENGGAKDEVDVTEQSLFIIADPGQGKKLQDLIQKWVKKYNQDAAVIKLEGDDKVSLMFKDGKIQPIGKWSPGKVAQAYSKLKNGRTFVFETAYEESGVYGKMAKFHSEKSQSVVESLDERLKKSYNNL